MKLQDSQHSHVSRACLTSVCSGTDQTAMAALIPQIRPLIRQPLGSKFSLGRQPFRTVIFESIRTLEWYIMCHIQHRSLNK
jgi:hypothetical protein